MLTLLKQAKDYGFLASYVLLTIGLLIKDFNKNFKVKIVFLRDRNRSRKCNTLISTDIYLSDDKIIRIYGKL